jgi:hypothetical protein
MGFSFIFVDNSFIAFDKQRDSKYFKYSFADKMKEKKVILLTK